MGMRIIALLASYNEERFIGNCLSHLARHGVDAYLIDDGSTDQTVPIAQGFLGKGLISIETFPREVPRDVGFPLHAILRRKAELATTLDADWFIHMDPDEVRLPPRSNMTLAEAFEEVDIQGYNAVNFLEYVFVPTRETPDHDHPDYEHTMHWYYPYIRHFPHRLNAWKRQPDRVDLASSSGHIVDFPGLRMFPESFPMRHYLFLSVAQAGRKYGPHRVKTERSDSRERWRSQLKPERILLPSQTELREYHGDDQLDHSNPRTNHFLAKAVPKASEGSDELPASDLLAAARSLPRIRGRFRADTLRKR